MTVNFQVTKQRALKFFYFLKFEGSLISAKLNVCMRIRKSAKPTRTGSLQNNGITKGKCFGEKSPFWTSRRVDRKRKILTFLKVYTTIM